MPRRFCQVQSVSRHVLVYTIPTKETKPILRSGSQFHSLPLRSCHKPPLQITRESLAPMNETVNPSDVPRSDNPVPFILPLFLFLLISTFYPSFADSIANSAGDPELTAEASSKTWTYLFMIGLQVVVASTLLIYFRKVYLEHFPIRFSPLSIVVGVVGVVLWIVVCDLKLEPTFWEAIGFNTDRPSFNPYTLDNTGARNLFLVSRFTVLAIVVPIIEELFVRGWLVRWIENPSWEHVGLTGLGMGALFAASIYGVVAHPSEAIAAFLWFGLVTWLMARTGNLWDCVVAHSVTNLLLGIYILKFEQWHLW